MCFIMITYFAFVSQYFTSEWSVLYVTIASFMIVVAIATVVWGMVCCCNRWAISNISNIFFIITLLLLLHLQHASFTNLLTNWLYLCVFLFPERRKSKVRRSKSRYKMLEADEQDSLELQPQRVGKTHTHTHKLSSTTSVDFAINYARLHVSSCKSHVKFKLKFTKIIHIS